VQHFPSLDHAILRQAISEVIHDDDVLWLVEGLDHHVRYADTWGLRKSIFGPVWRAKPTHRLHVESHERTNKQV
jgi:hypothetical protein